MDDQEPYVIRTPIWNGGNLEIGIADFRLPKAGYMRIELAYTSQGDGQKIRPGIYRMEAAEIRKCPIQALRNNVKVFVTRFADWEKIF